MRKPKGPDVPQLTYTVPEVAKALRISRRSVWRMIEDKRLRRLPKFGRSVRVSVASVERFANGARR